MTKRELENVAGKLGFVVSPRHKEGKTIYRLCHFNALDEHNTPIDCRNKREVELFLLGYKIGKGEE